MDSKLRLRRSRLIARPRKAILCGSLLVVAWLLMGAFFAVRTHAQELDRLTPIQREIERQRQRLTSSEVEERRDALMRLGNLKRPDASRVAASGLNDRIPIVRVTAAHAVVFLPPHEAASLLLPLLKDKSELVRREAAYALGDTRERSAVNVLVETLLRDKEAAVRGAAAVALGKIGDEIAVQALSQLLTGIDPAKKKKSKPIEDDFVMRSAAKSLGQIRSRAGVPALIAALENSANASDTRREAATALGLIGDRSAVTALKATLAAADDPYLAEAARAAIRRLRQSQN
jgi:HEAT repeat protein